jgi:hypothetical protein
LQDSKLRLYKPHITVDLRAVRGRAVEWRPAQLVRRSYHLSKRKRHAPQFCSLDPCCDLVT